MTLWEWLLVLGFLLAFFIVGHLATYFILP